MNLLSPRKAGVTGSICVADLLIVVIIALLAAAAGRYAVNWSFFRTMNFGVVLNYYAVLTRGLLVTLVMTASTLMLAFCIGFVVAILSTYMKSMQWIVRAYVEIFRGLPLLVTLYWVHFALPRFTGISFNIYVSGGLAMALQATALMIEVTRSGIGAVSKGQHEAATSLGLSALMRWRCVIMPQAMRIMLPSITNIITSMLKASAILSAIAVPQLWQVAQEISSYTFKPLETLTLAAVIYYLIGKLIIMAMRAIERKYVW